MLDSLFVIDSTFLLETTRSTFQGAPLLYDSNGHDTTMLFGFARDLLRLRTQLGMRKALVVIGDNQDELSGECRWVVKALRQKAGILMATNPSAAPVAAEIRARVESFRAHQARFNREREEYFASTLAKLRAAIKDGRSPRQPD